MFKLLFLLAIVAFASAARTWKPYGKFTCSDPAWNKEPTTPCGVSAMPTLTPSPVSAAPLLIKTPPPANPSLERRYDIQLGPEYWKNHPKSKSSSYLPLWSPPDVASVASLLEPSPPPALEPRKDYPSLLEPAGPTNPGIEPLLDPTTSTPSTTSTPTPMYSDLDGIISTPPSEIQKRYITFEFGGGVKTMVGVADKSGQVGALPQPPPEARTVAPKPSPIIPSDYEWKLELGDYGRPEFLSSVPSLMDNVPTTTKPTSAPWLMDHMPTTRKPDPTPSLMEDVPTTTKPTPTPWLMDHMPTTRKPDRTPYLMDYPPPSEEDSKAPSAAELMAETDDYRIGGATPKAKRDMPHDLVSSSPATKHKGTASTPTTFKTSVITAAPPLLIPFTAGHTSTAPDTNSLGHTTTYAPLLLPSGTVQPLPQPGSPEAAAAQAQKENERHPWIDGHFPDPDSKEARKWYKFRSWEQSVEMRRERWLGWLWGLGGEGGE